MGFSRKTRKDQDALLRHFILSVLLICGTVCPLMLLIFSLASFRRSISSVDFSKYLVD